MGCNRCKNTFDISEASVVYKKYGGVQIREKVCPVCGGQFRALEPPEDLDKYLFVDSDKRYYNYN